MLKNLFETFSVILKLLSFILFEVPSPPLQNSTISNKNTPGVILLFIQLVFYFSTVPFLFSALLQLEQISLLKLKTFSPQTNLNV